MKKIDNTIVRVMSLTLENHSIRRSMESDRFLLRINPNKKKAWEAHVDDDFFDFYDWLFITDKWAQGIKD